MATGGSELSMDGPGLLPLVGQGAAAGVAEHVGAGELKTSGPARSTILAKPAVMNGDPRSLTNTKSDASLSRRSRAAALTPVPK